MTFRRDKKNKLLYQHGRCRNKNEVILTEIPGEATPRSKTRSVRRDAASMVASTQASMQQRAREVADSTPPPVRTKMRCAWTTYGTV